MTPRNVPSYADLAYDVLRSAGRPLRFQEIFDEVERRRPITTRNPRGTIRNALTSGRQLINLGDGRYGYLPHLVAGSLLRVPLDEKKPAHHPLIFPDEVRHALWPSFFESQKRRAERSAGVRLPTGETAILALEFLGRGIWGSQVSPELRSYFVENRAAAGDSLLIRVGDAETGEGEAWLEPRRKRDDAAVTKRNRELVEAAEQIARASRASGLPTWDIVVPLLARGFYRADVAPDPLESLLGADDRFVDAGLSMWALAETLAFDELALIRERKRLEGELFQPAEELTTGSGEPPSPHALRYAMERVLADVGAALSERTFGSIDEANAFLQGALGTGGLQSRTPETPVEQAQAVMYDAWEAPRSRDRVRLAKEALRISPDCADAHVLLAEETARSPREAADLYAEGVAAGERALGREAFTRDVGHFWSILETRPYMRARFGLAQALWAMGRQREAIGHAREMLRLNPGDNQGVRYALLLWLLEIGDDGELGRLLDDFSDDASAIWLYARALHAFRTEGDTKRARKLLADARRENPHVPAYLLGRRRLPSRLPEMVGFGDESEAVVCAAEQLAAWEKTVGATAWLAAHAR